MVLLTSSAAPRRELKTNNRGWRLMMRVRLVEQENQIGPVPVRQQYLDPGSEDAGW